MQNKLDGTPRRSMLADFIDKVGNSECCECRAPKPAWASINLGIVFCIYCSGVHRSLGVHISEVRSLTLDDWKPEWINKCLKIGNLVSNAYYEANLPENYVRPNSFDDGPALAQFIKQKYSEKRWVHQTWKSPSELVGSGFSPSNSYGFAVAPEFADLPSKNLLKPITDVKTRRRSPSPSQPPSQPRVKKPLSDAAANYDDPFSAPTSDPFSAAQLGDPFAVSPDPFSPPVQDYLTFQPDSAKLFTSRGGSAPISAPVSGASPPYPVGGNTLSLTISKSNTPLAGDPFSAPIMMLTPAKPTTPLAAEPSTLRASSANNGHQKGKPAGGLLAAALNNIKGESQVIKKENVPTGSHGETANRVHEEQVFNPHEALQHRALLSKIAMWKLFKSYGTGTALGFGPPVIKDGVHVNDALLPFGLTLKKDQKITEQEMTWSYADAFGGVSGHVDDGWE